MCVHILVYVGIFVCVCVCIYIYIYIYSLHLRLEIFLLLSKHMKPICCEMSQGGENRILYINIYIYICMCVCVCVMLFVSHLVSWISSWILAQVRKRFYGRPAVAYYTDVPSSLHECWSKRMVRWDTTWL